MNGYTPPGRGLLGCTFSTLCSWGFIVFVLLSLACVTRQFLIPAKVFAAPASTINFQARLQTTAGSIAPDGAYNVEFKLYNASTGGTALWTETRLNANTQGVTVKNGYLTVNLGSVAAFPNTIDWSQQLYLTMNIGGTTNTTTPTWDGEMNPRLQLTASAYAFLADQANKLKTSSGSVTGDQLVQLSPASTQTGNVNISGNIVAGGSLQGSSATLGNATTQGLLVLNDGNGQTGTIKLGDIAANYSYTIPVTTADDTFCLKGLANCGSGISTIGALNGGTANATGASISGDGKTLYLQSASTSYAGLVSTGTQSFAGNKTFTGNLTTNQNLTAGGLLLIQGAGSSSIAGKLGIGTTTPTANLQVANINAVSFSLTTNSPPSTSNPFSSINFQSQNTSTSTWSQVFDPSEQYVYSQAYDPTTQSMYIGAGYNLYRCPTSTSCDQSSDWTLVYTVSGNNYLQNIIKDEYTHAIYATNTYSNIVRCDVSTGCDQSSDWSVVLYNDGGLNFGIDTTNHVMYLSGDYDLYRCDQSTNCDTSSDWVNLNDGIHVTGPVIFDRAHHRLYTSSYTYIYSCDTNTGCDNASDWVRSSVTNRQPLTIDANGILYSYNSDKNIYRCDTNTDCSLSANWTTLYTLAQKVNGMYFDQGANRLYVGTAASGIARIYYCSLGSDCSVSGSWNLDYQSVEDNINGFAKDTQTNTMYATTSGSGTVLRSGGFIPAVVNYAQVQALAINSQNTQETGALLFNTINNGLLTEGMRLEGGKLGVGKTAAYTMDVAGDINSTTLYRINGTAGASISCSGGNVLQNQVVQGGIVTGGSCASAGTGGITTIGALDGGTANTKGATISGSTLYLQSASDTNPGFVNIGSQTFAGLKKFNGGIIVSTGGATIKGGGLSLGASSQALLDYDQTGQYLGVTVDGSQILQLQKSSTQTYNVGDTGPAGGLIFYVSGNTYYEAAPSDLPDGLYELGCYGTDIAGADGTAIGTGEKNTEDIVAAGCSPNTAGDPLAATAAANYTYGGYNDWYLPSKDELTELWNQRSLISGIDTNSRYRSSSEIDSNSGWLQTWSGGSTVWNKYSMFPARAIRNFTINPTPVLVAKGGASFTGQLSVGTATQMGKIVLQDGSGYTATLEVAAGGLTHNTTYNIPNSPVANDTLCLQTLANCSVGDGGVTAIGTLDGGTANAKGATVSGSTLYLQSASTIYAGLVNTGTQSFAGNKTINGAFTVHSAYGDMTFDSSGELKVGGGAEITGNTTVDSSLNVIGAAWLNNGTVIGGGVSASATASLVQIGGAIQGGNANGTYLGLNAPSSGAGSAADLINLEYANTSVFKINSSGEVTLQESAGQNILSDNGAAIHLGYGGAITSISGSKIYLNDNTVVTGSSLTVDTLSSCASLKTDATGLFSCGSAGDGVTTVGALDGGTANATGATISGSTLYLQSASTSYPGLVNTGAQSFAGDKTFTGAITSVSGSLGVGTSSPSAALDVVAGLPTNNVLNISNIGTATTAEGYTGNTLHASREVTSTVTGTAAITLDNKTRTSASTTTSLSFAVANKSNRYLLVEVSAGINTFTNSGADPNPVISYAGTTMTLLGKDAYNGNGTQIWFYGLAAPAVGANTLSFSDAVSDSYQIGVSSWYNVNQSNPATNFKSTRPTSGSGTVGSLTSSTGAGQVVVDGASLYSGSLSVGSGQTIMYAGGGSIYITGSYKMAGSASTTMTQTIASAGQAYWEYASIILNPVATSPGPVITGAVASFSSNCTLIGGSGCADQSNILSLNQQFSGATGAVLNIQNSGTGDMLDMQNGAGVVFKVDVNGNTTISSTSAAAFTIQDASNNKLLVADTTNKRLYVGSSTPDATGVLLVLDTKNTSGDPTGTNGAMYYNSYTNKFRCYENGSWTDCITALPTREFVVQAHSSAFAWTIPAALTPFGASNDNRFITKVDLTGSKLVRLNVNMSGNTGTSSTAKIALQYSTDQTTWSYLDGGTGPYVMPVNGSDTYVSSWATITNGALGDVYIRAVGLDGDGTGSSAFNHITLQVK